MRIDLNDYAYFAEVVTHGGFAAAGRVLREPKTKLSRRIAGLVDRLGLRSIERSSRRFRVPDTRHAFGLAEHDTGHRLRGGPELRCDFGIERLRFDLARSGRALRFLPAAGPEILAAGYAGHRCRHQLR